MRRIESEELKLIQLDILREINDFCTQNGINYSLAYGTLLGAIRHKGYIPWDDDIDIMMLRPDYDRFIKSFVSESNHLEICAPELDLDYYATYANVWDNRTVLEEGSTKSEHRGKCIGIKIDIFPIDKTSSNLFFVFYTRILYKLWSMHRYRSLGVSSKRSVLSNYLLRTVADIIGYKNIQQLIIHNSKRFWNKDKEALDMLAFYNVGSRQFSIHDFDSYITVCFEGLLFSSIVGYDDYLRCAYGDYMRLPPEDKRKAHHGFQAYWKD